MIKRFSLSRGLAELKIDDDATSEDYIVILKWVHKKISEKNWDRIAKTINEVDNVMKEKE